MRRRFLEIGIIVLIFLILGLVYTYPLVKYFNKGIIYTHYPPDGYEVVPLVQGDHLHLYYFFWLFKDTVLNGGSFFVDPYQFSYDGEREYFLQIHIYPILFSLLSPLGDIFAFNSLVILSFIFAGGSAYLLVKFYTKNIPAAIIGGIIFTLSPYRLGQLGGHANAFLSFLIPLLFYLIEMALARRSLFYGALAGITFFASASMEYHLIYYILLILPFYLVFRLFFLREWFKTEGEIGTSGENYAPLSVIVMGAGISLGLFIFLVARGKNITLPLWTSLFFIGISTMLVRYLWLRYSRFISSITDVDLYSVRRADALSYLPLLLSPLYILKFLFGPIPKIGIILSIFILGGFIFLKTLYIFSHRKKIVFRNDSLEGFKKDLKALTPFFILGILTISYTYFVKKFLFGISVASGGRGLEEIGLFSPTYQDLFIKDNPLSEKFIYIGPFVLLLGIGAILWIFLKRQKDIDRIKERINAVFYGSVFLIFYILSLGPNFRAIPLYDLLYRFVPFFSYPRVTGRMVILSFLALSVLGGYAIKYILDISPAFKGIKGNILSRGLRLFVVVLIFFSILIDYFPSRPRGISLLSKGHGVYEILKRNLNRDEVLLELPIWTGVTSWSSIYQYYITLYRHKIVNGYSPAVSKKYIETIFNPLYFTNFGEIREEQYNLLKRLRVRHIIFHEEAYPSKISPYPPSLTLRNLKVSNYLRVLKEEDPMTLFGVLDKPEGNTSLNNTSIIGVLFEAENLPAKTGIRIEDKAASRGYATYGRAGKDKADYLTFGPYRYFPTGRYKAIFRVKASGDREDALIATLDVSTGKGEKILTGKKVFSKDFKGLDGYRDIILPYSIDEPSGLEFRVYFEGRGDLWVDYIYVLFDDQKDPLYLIEAEELWHTGSTVEDSSASSGYAVYVTETSTKEHVLSGPWRRFPPNRYRASFRMKIGGERTEDEVVSLSVMTDFMRREVGSLKIKSKDFNMEGYKDFTIDFTLSKDEILEFKVFYNKRSDLWIDRIKIEKDE